LTPKTKFGYLGKLPANHKKLAELPRFSTFLSSSLPQQPPVCNWIKGVTNWGPMGNDARGCCTVSGAGHIIQGLSYAATGTPVVLSDDVIEAKYIELTGYDPATGANDTGISCTDLLNNWRDEGIGGNHIDGYVVIDPTNTDEVQKAIYYLGAVYVGVNLPKSAEDQTDAGQPWDTVFWSPSIGGHLVPYMTYGPDGEECITWGGVQDVTNRFTIRQCDEMYAIVDRIFLTNSGRTPGAGLDVAGMLNAMQILRAA
jgi:hypothetical protein